MTELEARALADAIDPHYCVLVLTTAYTGMRAGEVRALRRRDVDLLRRQITVQRAVKEVTSRASWLIANGAQALQVMKRLGHRDIRTTFYTYGHVFPSDEAALAGMFASEPKADNVAELRREALFA